jgi:hypothetical protein
MRDLEFIPNELLDRCRRLIEDYHSSTNSENVSDLLWKSGLSEFIQSHPKLSVILKKASRSRSFKVCTSGFISIASIILALEVLASDYAGWGSKCPRERNAAEEILRRDARWARPCLMEEYVYRLNKRDRSEVGKVLNSQNPSYPHFRVAV